MNVLVTGSQGFVGSYVCSDLLSKGYRVVGIDNYSRYGNIYRPHDSHKMFDLIQDDLKLERFIDRLRGKRFDYIICCAAEVGGIGYFDANQYQVLAENNKITYNTIKYATVNQKLEKLIYLSSITVFEKTGKNCTEHHAITVPSNSYALQKVVAEKYITTAAKGYDIPYTILRLCNVVGAGEDLHVQNTIGMTHVIPDLVYKIGVLKQNPVTILGDGSQRRMFMDGKDVAKAIGLILDNTTKTDKKIYNLGTERPFSVADLASIIWKKLRPGEVLRIDKTPALASDVSIIAADSTLIREELGFVQDVSLNESIDLTIKYLIK
jgi:nucleoside-diphosphate-sugar epimerase